jgi:hypothetical protein
VTPLSGWTADIEYGLPDSLAQLNFWDGNGRFVGSLATSPPAPQLQITVIPEAPLVDNFDRYQIRVIVPFGGIPNRGGMSFLWPSEFGLSSINNIVYSDNYSGADLQIRWAFVYNHIVTVIFDWGQSPPAGSEITLTIENIRNPQMADQYQIAGLVFNRWFFVTAGPTFSNRFDIIPDAPVTLEVVPSDPLTLRAGDYQLFKAFGIDRFGNRTSELSAMWSLDGDIGTLNNGLLMATKTGQGLVMAEYDGLTAQSGLITVMPGELDKFLIIGTPDQVTAAEPFANSVMVAAIDAFNNIKFDYTGIVYFLSDDASATLPYTLENPFQFTESDAGVHEFEGSGFALFTSGERHIIATNGEKFGQSDVIIVNGGPIVQFELSGADTTIAGTEYILSVTNAVDRYGNPADGTINVELLAGNPSPNGDEPVLNVIEVSGGQGSAGQYFYAAERVIVRATSADGVQVDKSIKVIPGDIGALVLDIQPTQFVGHPLLGPATLTVSDAFGNLKTNFDASSNPVELITLEGMLTPSVLNNPDDFVAGIADLEKKGIIYNGPAGNVSIMARAGMILSNEIEIVFNGLAIAYYHPLPDTIYSRMYLPATITLTNNCNLTPIDLITINSFIASCDGECLNSLSSEGPYPGETIQRRTTFNTDILAPDREDTLVILVEYNYSYNDELIPGSVSLYHVVQVIKNYELEYVPNSLTIDSVISPGLTGSAELQLKFAGGVPDDDYPIWVNINMNVNEQYAQIGMASIDRSGGDSSIIAVYYDHLNIPDIESYGDFDIGYKNLLLQVRLYVNGQYIDAPNILDFDSLYVIKTGILSYINNSLSPQTVFSGTETSFSFDIESDGIIPIGIDPAGTALVLDNGLTTIRVALDDNNLVLNPGMNNITTETVLIPENLAGSRLSAFLDLSGTELYSYRTDSVLFSDYIDVSSASKEMRVITTYLDIATAPNAPFVNTNQLFDLMVGIENLSSSDIEDATVYLLSESGRDTLAVKPGISIPAEKTIEARLNLVAPATTIPVWALRTAVSAPGAATLPSIDNIAVLVVQRPARIELVYNITGTYDQYVEVDRPFTISAFLRNLGESDVGRGEISLVTGTDEFGLPDSTAVSLPLDSLVEFRMVAPLQETSALFNLKISGIPIDKNTNGRAEVANASTLIPINVIKGESELFIQGRVNPSPLIVAGETTTLFELTLNNRTQSPLNVIGLNTIVVVFRNKDGHLISPDRIVDTALTAFTEGDDIISAGFIYASRLNNEFVDLTLDPGQNRTIAFRCRFADQIDEKNFSVSIDSRDILARYISGPRAGQRVTVSGDFGESLALGGNFVVTPPSLEGSIIARKNPFNPEVEPAEVSYFLEEDADMEVIIFTLTGEKVLEMSFAAGAEGGRAGDNVIYWYGTNARNHVVLNGVYIMVLKNTVTGESYRYKLAVLK